MPDAQHWRRLAEQALRNAGTTTDPHTKAVLMSIAEEYLKLAERAEAKNE
jgi:hypothetical protein